MPEAGELRKDEPHPVALFLALAQLGENTLIDRRLRVNEAPEIERIGHRQPPSEMARRLGEPLDRGTEPRHDCSFEGCWQAMGLR
jgi:hypothetical protein